MKNCCIINGNHPMCELSSNYNYTGLVFHSAYNTGIDTIDATKEDTSIIYVYQNPGEGKKYNKNIGFPVYLF